MHQVENKSSKHWNRDWFFMTRETEQKIRELQCSLQDTVGTRSRGQIFETCKSAQQPGDQKNDAQPKRRCTRQLQYIQAMDLRPLLSVHGNISTDYIKLRVFKTVSKKKCTSGWRILDSFGAMDPSVFHFIFGNWPQISTGPMRYTANTPHEALNGYGRYFTRRALNIDMQQLHDWCQFQRFDSIRGDGASIIRRSDPLVRRILIRVEVTYLVDRELSPGEQTQLKIYAIIGSYGPFATFKHSNILHDEFEDLRQRCILHLSARYPLSAAPPSLPTFLDLPGASAALEINN